MSLPTKNTAKANAKAVFLFFIITLVYIIALNSESILSFLFKVRS